MKWFSYNCKDVDLDKDILFRIVYIPPRGSLYTNITHFGEIQEDLLELNVVEKYQTCILGDFNAHTGTMDDFVSLDKHLLGDLFLDPSIVKLLDVIDSMDLLDIPKNRISKCKSKSWPIWCPIS